LDKLVLNENEDDGVIECPRCSAYINLFDEVAKKVAERRERCNHFYNAPIEYEDDKGETYTLYQCPHCGDLSLESS
jgi:predicted RNA-binding Zn-ribbon protein involved in translation (DUF1610 family)